MPDPTFKIDSTTVLSKSGTTVSVDSGLNIKPAFSALDSSASNGPTSGTAVTKSTSLPLFGCRAFVNFDGTSTTSISSEDCCAIRASGNVSKVVRNGTGIFTITFATAMPDANYSVVGLSGRLGDLGERFMTIRNMSTSSCKIDARNSSGNYYDNDINCVTVFR